MMESRTWVIAPVLLALGAAACAAPPADITSSHDEQLHPPELGPWHALVVDCSHEQFEGATRLAELPTDVQVALQRSGPVSDRGGSLNPGDIVMPENRDEPMKRLGVAAISQRYVFAAVEHGGFGYGVDIWAFERPTGEHWIGERHWVTNQVPASLSQFVTRICTPGRQYPTVHQWQLPPL